MKNWLFLLPFLLLATTGLRAQEISFDSTTIDYGSILKGSEGKRLFEFRNTGDSPLMLTQVKTSCSCSATSYTRRPVMPGEKGQIEVHYDTNYVGRFEKYIYVASNARNTAVVKLCIKGQCHFPDSE